MSTRRYIDRIDSPEQLRQLAPAELPAYCRELREFIIREVSTNPGHLGASLGAVELAVAIHYVYDTPTDKLVWDVGHQAYAHKIITGRREQFHTNRKLGGLSGFPRMSESPYDAFGAGHASVSVSAALGLAIAQGVKTVAVIGDGAISGGLAFEGLNNAGAGGKHDLLVILNDNRISIDPNVGAIKERLLEISTSRGYNRFKDNTWAALARVPRLRRTLQKVFNGAKSFFLHQSNLFESFNFRYFGPVDGNDVQALVRALRDLRRIPGPKLLHALTLKGKGYQPAELDQTGWHAPGRFNPDTGERPDGDGKLRFQDVFGHTLVELAHAHERIVGITPAMPTGSSMNLLMAQLPERAFDVGIAEEHAVTFAAGLAAGGKLPFCSIYSSFAQRAVDNVIHDAALQGLDVVLCLDRAGLVGEDGATHHGAFDIPIFRAVPGITFMAPMDARQLRGMLHRVAEGGLGTCIIRYPRGGCFDASVLADPVEPITIGKGRTLHEPPGPKRVAILSLGELAQEAAAALSALAAEGVTDVGHYDLRFIKPLDGELLHRIAELGYEYILTIENGVVAGGVGSAVLEFYTQAGLLPRFKQFIRLGLPDRFVEQGTVAELKALCGLDAASIARRVLDLPVL